MKMMMRELGVTNILRTSNLTEALGIVINKKPDIIISDWAPKFDAMIFVNVVR